MPTPSPSRSQSRSSRRDSATPPRPRPLDALPYAHRLSPFSGEIEPEGVYEWLHFDGSALEDLDGESSRFSESAFSSVTFTGGGYRRSRFDDVWLNAVRMVGTDLSETTWLNSECSAGILAGTEIHSAGMHRVVFHGCKFDSVNLRGAALRDVAFVDCLLRDVDFGGATLTGTSFPGSTLDGVHLRKATLADVGLHEAAGLHIASGLEALNGATISSTQLLDLAPALAQVIGLTVRDGAGRP
ncbi:pentapeptide repeat-containing protein [Streptomyces luomodiensis]|uniref:pentapeptide repeat-containing protein n=1 Tax=Streptomyces luomodiensis TaxID=3026192 RepID=UPI003D77D524